MAASSIASQPFYGRQSERGQFRRALEGRTGGQIGFSGIGGIGKSTLLGRFFADAQELKITDYVVYLDLAAAALMLGDPPRPIITPLDLLCALITALEATGKTKQRRLIFTKDSLADCKSIRNQLLAQPQPFVIHHTQNIAAEYESTIGNVRTEIPVTVQSQGKRITVKDLFNAFRDAVRRDLPSPVRMPVSTASMLQRRLLVLLVDNVDQASRDVQQALLDLHGILPENCLLVCAGREEDSHGAASSKLLPAKLDQLDEPSAHAWLSQSGIHDRELHDAVYKLTGGVPLLVKLAIEQIGLTQNQGQRVKPADFQLSPTQGVVSRAVAEQFLVESYLKRLENGTDEDRQLRDLILYGCVLRRFEPIESARQIGAVNGDVGKLIRSLEQRGFLTNRRMHEVLQRCALAYLRAEEPRRFKELTEAMERYYQQLEAAYVGDALYAQIVRGDADVAQKLLTLVAQRLAAGDIRGAAEIIAAAQAAPFSSPSLSVAIEFAKVDQALAEGAHERTQERLARLLASDMYSSENDQLVQQRLDKLQIVVPQLMLWRLQHQPPSAAVVEQAQQLGDALCQKAHLALAQQFFVFMLDVARTIEDRQGEAYALLSLGQVAEQRDQLAAAERFYTEALGLYRAVEHRLGAAHALWSLGEVARQRCQWAIAERFHTEALGLYRAVEHRLGAAHALWSLGEVARQRGDLASARQLAYQALSLYEDIEDLVGVYLAAKLMVQIAEAEGNTAEAIFYRSKAQDAEAEQRKRR